MPTYEWSCTVCNSKKETFVQHMNPETPSCCDQPMKKGIGGGFGFQMNGESPSKDYLREREDESVRSVVRRAKQMKASGYVEGTEHLTAKDVNHHNPE